MNRNHHSRTAAFLAGCAILSLPLGCRSQTAQLRSKRPGTALAAAPSAADQPGRRGPTLEQTEKGTASKDISQVQFETPDSTPALPVVERTGLTVRRQDAESDSPLPSLTLPQENVYPIDLATALKLAGAGNLQIEIAAERIQEAYAKLDGAKALWIPSLNAGVGYNKHDGRIQATEGEVLEVSRSSLFTGGGALLSGAPLTGGSGGPARFFVDISPADIHFEPLAARQLANAAHAGHVIAFNDTLLEVASAYLELEQGQWQVAIAAEAVANADELVRLTENFARQGAGLEADAARARAERADRRRQLFAAQERVGVASAELARLLRLDSRVTLFAAAPAPAPVAVIEENLSLDELVILALGARPELSRQQALVAETIERMRQEKWRPWLPNIHLGASGGGFGGGEGSFIGNYSGRSDFDALAVWQLQNLGLGNRARQRERESRHRQACLTYDQTLERIAAEVAAAYRQVESRRRQIEQAKLQVESARSALPLNFAGIRGRELRAVGRAPDGLPALAGDAMPPAPAAE